MNINTVLKRQEDEYWFPYHYIARFAPDSFKQHFIDTWGINYVSTIEFILQKINHDAPESLVDIGCGDGRMTREIFTRLSIPYVCGIDYSVRAVNLARSMNQDLSRIKFKQTDVFIDEFIRKHDAAVLMEVFEHIPVNDAMKFLEGVRRSLNIGGRLYLTVPHTNKILEDKHFQHFTINSVCDYLKKDFKIVEVIPFEKKGIKRRILNMILSNRFFILQNRWLLDYAYKWYKKNLFHCSSEKECQRIFVKAVAK